MHSRPTRHQSGREGKPYGHFGVLCESTGIVHKQIRIKSTQCGMMIEMSSKPHSKRGEPTLPEYRDAVWAFLLEHSDIAPNGKIFVKFHADSRKNIENRIKARYKYEYHREEKRPEQKELKRKANVLNQKEMEKALVRLKWENELLIHHPMLHRLYTGGVVARRRTYSAMVQFSKVWSYVLRIWTAIFFTKKGNR